MAFLPYLQHFLGQSPAPNSSSGGGSGILGCLYSKDWAVRRAAADALSATALLLGPGMEPEGAWGVGDPASLTGRCLAALENARFDKVSGFGEPDQHHHQQQQQAGWIPGRMLEMFEVCTVARVLLVCCEQLYSSQPAAAAATSLLWP